MLARVARLEQARSPASPFELWYGSLEAWEAEVRAGMDDGHLDASDVPVVMVAVQRWHSDGVWTR